MIFGFILGFSLVLFSSLENQLNQLKLNSLDGSGPYKSWWPFFKEGWTLVSLFAEVPEEWKMGTSVGEKGSKHQSLRAAESSVTALKETGQGGDKEKTSPRPCSCEDNHLLLDSKDTKEGCEQDWAPDPWIFLDGGVGNPCWLSLQLWEVQNMISTAITQLLLPSIPQVCLEGSDPKAVALWSPFRWQQPKSKTWSYPQRQTRTEHLPAQTCI